MFSSDFDLDDLDSQGCSKYCQKQLFKLLNQLHCPHVFVNATAATHAAVFRSVFANVTAENLIQAAAIKVYLLPLVYLPLYKLQEMCKC